MTWPFAGSRASGIRGALILCAVALSACGTGSAVPDSSAAVSSTVALPTRVTLERKPCYGTCPVYRLAVGADGLVTFEGLQHVDSIGRFTGRIDAERVAALSRLFEEQDYFALDDKYLEGERNCQAYAMDAPTVITSVTAGAVSKRVEHDLGCTGVPQRLHHIESRIDEIVGTVRWIRN